MEWGFFYSHIDKSIARGPWSDSAIEFMHFLFNIDNVTVTTENFTH